MYRSSGVTILFKSRSALQAVQKGWCQISHGLIQSINKVAAAGRSRTLQWILTQVNILGYEKADELAKESRFCPKSSKLKTLFDANGVANSRPINNSFKFSIPSLNCNRTLASIIIRLRTKHVMGVKSSVDGQRSYKGTHIALTFDYLLNMPLAAQLFRPGFSVSD